MICLACMLKEKKNKKSKNSIKLKSKIAQKKLHLCKCSLIPGCYS